MVSALELGRGAFRRCAWGEAFVQLSAAGADAGLAVDDFGATGDGGLSPRKGNSVDVWARAYHRCLGSGTRQLAGGGGAWLVRGRGNAGGGWLARAQLALDEAGLDGAERGWLLIPQAMASFADDPEAALARFVAAGEIANRFGDRDLAALAGMGRDQTLISLGDWARAMPFLDEAMVAVTAGGVSPIVAGGVLCGAIDACQRVLDVRRASEWTAALSRWCETQPDLVPFRGQCLVHRAEIMQLHGDWQDAVKRRRRACECLSGTPAVGDAMYRHAELLRVSGDLQRAEETYRAAHERWAPTATRVGATAAGSRRVELAVAAIRRVVDETVDTLTARVLGPFVEIMLAAGETDRARAGADELGVIAGEVGTAYVRALTAHAAGAVRVAEGDPQGAIAELRRPGQHGGTGRPVRGRQRRLLIGVAFRAVGDADTAAMELDAARLAFDSIGAGTDVARVEQLLEADR